VIQSPASVIQSAPGQFQISKGNVILVPASKSNSVIQTTASGAIQAIQIKESSEESNEPSDRVGSNGRTTDTNKNKRREILSRRPSYRKILSDLGGSEISSKQLSNAGACTSYPVSVVRASRVKVRYFFYAK